MKKIKNISIIGYGRFGKVWAEFLKSDFNVFVCNKSKILPRDKAKRINFVSINEALKKEVIFLCIPISALENFLKKNRKNINKNALVIDVCSVKTYPINLMKKYLPRSCEIIGTHPMFGPDSFKKGRKDLKIVLSKVRQSRDNYEFWKKYFKKKKLKVVELSANEHDRLASRSQSIVHYIGRVLGELDLKETKIDTLGFKRLYEIIDQTCNDTEELFYDLQNKNPYGERVRKRIEKSFKKINYKLVKEKHKIPIVGIQGGEGSFNEEVIRTYCEEFGLSPTGFKIKYLYNSDNVLRNLERGKTDYGVMALYNSVGGAVVESMEALAQYECKIVEIIDHVISHHLMVQKGVKLSQIKKIISHPQTLKQCKRTLTRKFPHIEKEPGKGKLIDQSTAAKYLAEGKLPKSIGVIAPKICAELFELDILVLDLQDSSNNETSFAFIKK